MGSILEPVQIGLIETSLRQRSERKEALHQSAPEAAGRLHQNVPEVGEAVSPQRHLWLGPSSLCFGPCPLWVAGHPIFPIPLMEPDSQQELLWSRLEEEEAAPAACRVWPVGSMAREVHTEKLEVLEPSFHG